MVRNGGQAVSLGFYPEKTDSQHTLPEEHASLSVQKIHVPDKKNLLQSARYVQTACLPCSTPVCNMVMTAAMKTKV